MTARQVARLEGRLSDLSAALAKHAGWVAGSTVALAVLLWLVAVFSIARQLDKPFPGFFYNPEGVVSGFTPKAFTGLQAGLRPWDIIQRVNGQSWHEMPRLVAQADVGTVLVYTVERQGRLLDIPVATMPFTREILWDFLPGYLLSGLVFLAIGIFVYLRNPPSALHLYLLIYLLVWAVGGAIVWECFLSQQKWMGWLLVPYAIAAPVAGWVFLWSFPADEARKAFLRRWPVTRGFVVFGLVIILLTSGLRALAYFPTEHPELREALVVLQGWPYFAVFGLGSVVVKLSPVLNIGLQRKDRLIRQQAVVICVGLILGLAGWYLFLWAPAAIHIAPVAQVPWGGLISALYPLSIGYAILRYQLLDIRVAVRRGLVYSLLTAALTALFLLVALVGGYVFQASSGAPSLLAMLVAALLVAFLFQPVRNRIQALVDRAFFHHDREVRQTLTEFSRSLSRLRERGEVVDLVVSTVRETLGAKEARVWLLRDDRYSVAGAPDHASATLAGDSPLSSELARQCVSLSPQSPGSPAAAADLERLGAALAVPLLLGEKLVGILMLGEKHSGEPYGQDDLELLSMLAQSAALAMENARLHEERLEMLRQQFMQAAEVQEEERRRIARELHDGVGPSLASLNLQLLTLRKELLPTSAPLAAEIEGLASQAQANLRDIRRLIYDLRPAVLDELGLAPALREYAGRYQQERQINLSLALDENSERFPAPLEAALYRIIQEALANVAKHAQASQVRIELSYDGRAVALRIADDGCGFVADAPLTGTHLGLWSIGRRVEQFGGAFNIHSELGQGTCLEIIIPHRGEASGPMAGRK